jgi:hypothetical protein
VSGQAVLEENAHLRARLAEYELVGTHALVYLSPVRSTPHWLHSPASQASSAKTLTAPDAPVLPPLHLPQPHTAVSSASLTPKGSLASSGNRAPTAFKLATWELQSRLVSGKYKFKAEENSIARFYGPHSDGVWEVCIYFQQQHPLAALCSFVDAGRSPRRSISHISSPRHLRMAARACSMHALALLCACITVTAARSTQSAFIRPSPWLPRLLVIARFTWSQSPRRLFRSVALPAMRVIAAPIAIRHQLLRARWWRRRI